MRKNTDSDDGRRLTRRNASRLVNDSYFLELLSEALDEFDDEDEAVEAALDRYFGSFGEIA
ncbi:hypothetical protein ACEU6E_09965 [Halorutilales archaeon Cl-col2-1]